METLGDRIKTLMDKYGFTQKELASMVGVTESAMSRYLKDEREPKIEVISNLATALGTTSDYLISGTEPEDSVSELYRLVARSSARLTEEQKMELIRILLK